MMLLPPIDPIVGFVDKGLMRRLIDSACLEVGITGNTFRNIQCGRTKPSTTTFNKVERKFPFFLPFNFGNLFSLRSLARKNEWAAYLEGLRKGGLPSDFFPNLQCLIERLVALDEEVEHKYRNTGKLIQCLERVEPNIIVSDEISYIKVGMNRQEVRAVLGASRVKVALLLISCFEAEMMLISRSSCKDSIYQLFMKGNPRHEWVKLCLAYTGASSINELSRLYTNHFSSDYESAKRMIRRVSEGKHRVQSTSLENIISLCESERCRYELKVAYYVSEIVGLLTQVISFGEKEGIVCTSSSDLLDRCYRGCFSYWQNKLGIVT